MEATTVGHAADGTRPGGTDPGSEPTWAQVARRPRRPFRLSVPVVVAVGVVPVVVQLARLGLDPGRWAVAATALVVLVAAAARPPVAAGAVVVAVVAVTGDIGPIAAIVAVAAVGAWCAVAGRAGPATDRPDAPPALGALAIASVLLALRAGLVLPALLVALAVALLAVDALVPDPLRRLADAIDRAAGAAARILSMLAMVPVALVVALVWLGHRLVGYDPLHRPDGWAPVPPADPHPERLHGPGDHRPHGWRRLQRAAATCCSLALVLGVAVVVARPRPEPPSSPVFADDADFDQLWRETQGFVGNIRYDPVTVYAMGDYRSTQVNQVDGVRTTWAPPPCDCRRLRVWWFGGSAAWGFYQGDQESPPSQLARAAWEDGLALDIENRALPGYTLAQEVQRFAWLAESEPAPDLVIFYDGANELSYQVTRNDDGRGLDASPASFVDPVFETAFGAFRRLQGLVGRSGPGERIDEPDDDPTLDAPEVAGVALERYRRGMAIAERTAAAVGAEVVFAWQPVESTAEGAYAPFEGTAPWRPADERWWQRLAAGARDELPDEVVDLSDALDDPPAPVMPDWEHTNAAGAELVATALLAEVEPTLRALAADG